MASRLSLMTNATFVFAWPGSSKPAGIRLEPPRRANRRSICLASLLQSIWSSPTINWRNGNDGP